MNFILPYNGNFRIPTDELIFFRRVGTPPTRYVMVCDGQIPNFVYDRTSVEISMDSIARSQFS